MSRLIQLEIKQQESFRIVGKVIRPRMGGENPIPAFWDACFGDGTFSALESLGEWVLCPDYVGFMTGWQGEDGTFAYVAGMMMKPGCPLPEGGFVTYDVPASPVAIGLIQGNSTPDVCMPAHEFTHKALEEKGYTDRAMTWCMELYNCPRFTTPDESGNIILDYYIPCQRL